MQLINFSLGNDNVIVNFNDLIFDLHNNFDFIEYNYVAINNSFQLRFKKSSGEWAKNEVFEFLIFKFSQVSFIKINGKDLSNNPRDYDCLDIIGFSSPDMKDNMDSFLGNSEFRNENDMIFIFVTGHSIKIHSESVFLEAY